MYNIFNRLKKTDNIFSLILIGLAFGVGWVEYGIKTMFYTTIFLASLSIFIGNIIEVYIYLKSYLKKESFDLPKKRFFYLSVSTIIVTFCFFYFLPRKAQIAILIFCSILLGALFLYDLIKTAIKSLF